MTSLSFTDTSSKTAKVHKSMDPRTIKRNLFIRIGLGILFVLIGSLSVGFATIAFFLLARSIRNLRLITAVSAGVLFLSAWAGGLGLASLLDVANPGLLALIYAGLVWLLTAFLAWRYVFRPAGVMVNIPQPSLDTRFWALETGSRLAYTHLPANGTARDFPIIYLHGGPGIPMRTASHAYFRRFTEDGYHVYLYDQVGVGLSDRPADIREYNLARNVADLEAIRQTLGVEKMVLMGTSWGGVLAAHYMAAHPGRVARAVLISPGVLGDRRAVKYDYKVTASSEDDSVILPSLRFIVAGALARIQPEVAQQFASQIEMGAVYDNFTTNPSVDYQTNCKGYKPASTSATRSGGSNYYANLLTLASLRTAPDPRPALKTNPTPVLILRGECDYIPLEGTLRYKETLPNAVFVPISGAGHAVTGAQPELSLATIRAFLADQPLPFSPQESNHHE